MKTFTDAERYVFLVGYLQGPRDDLDEAIIDCTNKEQLDAVVDADLNKDK